MGRGKLLFTVLACYGLSLTSCNQEPRTRVCIDWSTKTLSGESEKKLGNIGSLPDYVIEEGTVFIDKTLLLKELLETDKKIVVITAPRKFGKSFNLDMLRHFVEICNEEGEDIVPPKETNKYHFFTEGKIHLYTDVMIRRYNKSLSYRTKEYVPPPLISKHRKIIDKYMGQYPVLNIFLEFTMPAEDEETFDIFLWHFRNHVCRLVRAHTYLEDWFTDMMYETELSAGSNPSVTKEPFKSKEKDFRQLRRYKFEERNLTYSEILHGLQFLTRLLHEYYGKPSYLLIDDWISPLLDDALDGSLIGKEEREKLIKFIADFMRVTVKENPYVKQVYLSGVLSVNLEELLSPFSPDEIIHYNVFNNDLHEFYGFTENEVKDLLKYFDFAPGEIKRSLQYYRGYKFKKDSKLLLYNPWSLVVKASRDEDIRQQFWVDTSEMKLLEKWKKIDRYNRILGSLINGSSVSIEYNDMRIEYDDFLFKIDTVWGKDEKTDDKAINYIFSYLLQTGYVTMSDDPKPLEVVKNILPQRKINVRIPNKEVRDWFTRASTEYEY